MIFDAMSQDYSIGFESAAKTLEEIVAVLNGDELKIYTPPKNNVVEVHFDCINKDEIVFLRLDENDVIHVTGIGDNAVVNEYVLIQFMVEKLAEYTWIANSITESLGHDLF